jgi:hypothetical protein
MNTTLWLCLTVEAQFHLFMPMLYPQMSLHLLNLIKPFFVRQKILFQSTSLLQEIVLPKFQSTAYIKNCNLSIFHWSMFLIFFLGHAFLHKVNYYIEFDVNTMTCMEMTFSRQSSDFFTNRTCLHDTIVSDDIVSDDIEVDSFASIITGPKCKINIISDVIDAQKQLSSDHSVALSNILTKQSTLFDGVLIV